MGFVYCVVCWFVNILNRGVFHTMDTGGCYRYSIHMYIELHAHICIVHTVYVHSTHI